ncbi:MAG: hypothetical protein IJE25_03990 [Clostridia bacterium]|nr:hypothetical protein [Clostridia bacterium]
MKNVYSPNDYKELGSDSAMIQAAVDEAAKYGAAVVIPRYNERTGKCIWELDATIELYSGSFVTLENCHLRLMDNTYIHFFENSSARFGVEWWRSETRQHDIQIIGVGNALLDGGNHNGVFESNFNIYDDDGKFIKKTEYMGFTGIYINRGIQFRNVERVTVRGLRFINQRYWAMSFEYCSFGHVADITFEAMANVPNQDGIDIRVGCHNFLIENIAGLVGDDTVAITNFGVDGDYDMDPDIHDIIIKNIRTYQTSACDAIRILNRGGFKIYNVEISNVVDISPAFGERRALAAIRIGDLNDYPARLNLLGETRNIVVRDVITRARFGVYVANSLADATFDNIMMVSDGGIGMYFNGCELKNVYINKLLYGVNSEPPASDVGYTHVHHRVKIDRLSAICFNNCRGENISVRDIVCAKGLSCAIDVNSPLDVKTSGIELAEGVEGGDAACG